MTAKEEKQAVIAEVKAALKRRSGKEWSVTGGKGTAWGYILVSAPPRRMNGYAMTEADCQELHALLGYNTRLCMCLDGIHTDDWDDLLARARGEKRD
jgi:hypothetical protein